MTSTRHRAAPFIWAVLALTLFAAACTDDSSNDASGQADGETADDSAQANDQAQTDDEAVAFEMATSSGEPVASAGCGSSTVAATQNERLTLTSGGAERWYLRSVPPAHDGETPVPVVLDLHGFVEGAQVHAAVSALGDIGTAEGFVVVTPHGTDPDAEGPEPVYWDVLADSPDSAFVHEVLDQIETDLCVDTARVYVTGFSNGAFMTSSLACDAAERFAAAAPVAGVFDFGECGSARAVPVMVFQGTGDCLVTFDGEEATDDCADDITEQDEPAEEEEDETSEAFSDLPEQGSIPDRVDAWAARNGCDATSTETPVSENGTRTVYDCADDASVEFYVITGAGHIWPGSVWSNNLGPLGVGMELDASALMWEFFQQHHL